METSVHSVTLPPAPELCETTSGRHSENSGRNSGSSNSCEGFRFAFYPQCISLALWRQHSRGPRTSLPMFKPEVLSFLSFLVFCKRLRAMACAPEDCVNRWTQNGAQHVTVCVGYHLSPSLLNYRVPCLSAVTMHGLWNSTRQVWSLLSFKCRKLITFPLSLISRISVSSLCVLGSSCTGVLWPSSASVPLGFCGRKLHSSSSEWSGRTRFLPPAHCAKRKVAESGHRAASAGNVFIFSGYIQLLFSVMAFCSWFWSFPVRTPCHTVESAVLSAAETCRWLEARRQKC